MENRLLEEKLLAWYAEFGRDLPWRIKGGAHPNPYVVLVSEVMLQQTTVKTVIPYFERFMKRFPDIESLAKAPLDDVYALWQGLGYYSRARSLHATAQIILQNFDGKFPSTREDVLKLKGIGSYTVASFLALAFNQPETVVDGNVLRIIARLYHLTEPLEDIKPQILEYAAQLTSTDHPADYASAIMDLGATVCTPKNPQCLICPWQQACLSSGKPDIDQIPQKRKMLKQHRTGFVYLIIDSHNRIALRQRTEKGLLSGLYEFPWNEGAMLSNAENLRISVTHIFTHIQLTLNLCLVHSETPLGDTKFVEQDDIKNYPMSTLMKKVWNAYLKCLSI
jgi:A/G-specific adenine glycosylase